ncbi:hypothetical protein GCM10025868_02040 [Angustibacter aerolatus]|uniref:Uncharacterized protein n=1 Tax=Angustibacter aerolatus TaxID=1162965 RepID=A0ABQ6JBX7_9ACTN|nr:hypothetical protein GCM10025868_02040 [Angustibacter aerolatus]
MAITRPAPKVLASLHRDRADAPGRRVHDDGLAGREACRRAQQVPGGGALQHQRQRGGVVDGVRQVEDHRGVRGGDLGVPAAAGQQRDDASSVVGAAHDLGAGHQRQGLRREVGVLGLVGVGEVDARAGDGDAHEAVGRRLGQVVVEGQDLGSAELGDLDAAHGRRVPGPGSRRPGPATSRCGTVVMTAGLSEKREPMSDSRTRESRLLARARRAQSRSGA